MKSIYIQPLAITPDSTIGKAISGVDAELLPILEIFHGIEGEGLEIGEPRVLVRVGGCRVSCSGCDTPHSWGLKGSSMYSIAHVMEDIGRASPCGQPVTVAVTGGEPMHYPEQMLELALQLREAGIRSWLETSGLILNREVFDAFDVLSLDVKTPSSGVACFTDEAVATFKSFFEGTDYNGQIKMIVTDVHDIDWIKAHFNDWLTGSTPFGNQVVITPAFGKDSTLEQVKQRMELAADSFHGLNVRIIAQQHAMLSMR